MGWSFYNSHGKTTEELLRAEVDSPRGKIIDLATVGGTVYMAYQYAADAPSCAGETVALVFLTKRDKRARDGMDFGYKGMDEDMGPCEDRCPARILDLLTPTTNTYALEWRARCRASAETRKATTAALSDGQVIEFEEPLHFTNGAVEKLFTVCKRGRKTRFTSHAHGFTASISNLHQHKFVVRSPGNLQESAA